TYRADVGDTSQATGDVAEVQSWDGGQEAEGLEESDAGETVDTVGDVDGGDRNHLALDEDGRGVHLGGSGEDGGGEGGEGEGDLGELHFDGGGGGGSSSNRY
ncbi:hypothetical protein QBC41DRAFT_230613, partial [Cercophora samala]